MMLAQMTGILKCLPCYGGVQLAVDITLRSVLACQGESHAHAADTDGAIASPSWPRQGVAK